MPFLRRHFLLLCWLLLILPTLALGWVAWRALQAEERILRDDLRLQYQREGERIREDLILFVLRMRQELMRTLIEVDPNELELRLTALRQQEPYVRNAFIREPSGRLSLPRPGRPLDREEAAFVERFASLFNQDDWPRAEQAAALSAKPVQKETESAKNQLPRPLAFSDRSSSVSSAYASEPRGRYAAEQEAERFARRQNMIETQRTMALAEEMADAAPEPVISMRSAAPPLSRPVEDGWIPWFWGSDFSLLGWVRTEPNNLVYGAEMEMDTLYARLPAIVPDSQNGLGVVLVDARGRSFHRSTAVGDAPGVPDFNFDLGDALPHWRMHIYLPVGWSDALGGFRTIGRYVVLGVLAAIVGSGTLLLWTANRHRRDSLQKSGFVSSVSHELKTPLTTIRLHAEMLGEQRVRDPDKRQRYLDTIVDETQRLTRLVNNVLDFSRLEKQRHPRNPQHLDLGPWLAERIRAVQPRAEQAGFTIKGDIQEPSAVAVVDPDALEQVFLNLVDNAIKYAASGGELRIELMVTPDAVEMRFADRGPGVPRAHRQRIFEAFHRVDNSLTARSAGCGLGLNIAARLLREEGGALTYRDNPGGGACFTVRLPRERPELSS